MFTTGKSKKVADTIVNGIFLIGLNLILMLIIGYLTLDSSANLNSRMGAVLLSFLIPYLIVSKTLKMSGIERMLKFGFGYMCYTGIAIYRSIVIANFTAFSLSTFLIPCLGASLVFLYYGDLLFDGVNG